MTAFSTAQLEDALRSVEPMTEDDVARTQRLISRRAWEVTREHRQICERLGDANAEAELKYDSALTESYALHHGERGWTVARHEAAARLAASDEKATVFALTLMERSLRREGEILERLASVLQTETKRLTGLDTPFDNVRGAA